MHNSLDTCDRYIAFFDIIGFKNKILEKKHEEIVDLLCNFFSSISDPKQYKLTGFFDQKSISCEVKYAFFSDSILIISKDSSDLSNLAISYASIHVLTIALLYSIPIKGAIACGKMTADFSKSLFVGKPLIDAYLLQEDQNWFGVINHHTADRAFFPKVFPDEKINPNYISLTEEYLVPFKSGKAKHTTYNWPFFSFLGHERIIELINCLKFESSGINRIFIENTFDYLNYVTDKYPIIP